MIKSFVAFVGMRRLERPTPTSRTQCATNCATFRSRKWCHQESNRGHKDFQSFALPTELWHLSRLRVQRYGKGSIYPNTIGIFFGRNFIMYSFIMIRTKLYPVSFSLVLTFKTKSLSPNEKLKYSLLDIPAICKIEYIRILVLVYIQFKYLSS